MGGGMGTKLVSPHRNTLHSRGKRDSAGQAVHGQRPPPPCGAAGELTEAREALRVGFQGREGGEGEGAEGEVGEAMHVVPGALLARVEGRLFVRQVAIRKELREAQQPQHERRMAQGKFKLKAREKKAKPIRGDQQKLHKGR
ncbi:MAG: hypothetical protein SGPRY_013792, partial [Prymnesium sp.]